MLVAMMEIGPVRVVVLQWFVYMPMGMPLRRLGFLVGMVMMAVVMSVRMFVCRSLMHMSMMVLIKKQRT